MTDRSRAKLLAIVLAIQTCALGWMTYQYDPDARYQAQSWESVAAILSGALDRCHAPRNRSFDIENRSAGPSDNRA